MIERTDHQQKFDEKAREIVRDLGNWANNMGHDNRAFVETVMNEHRTIQQQLFETMLCCMAAWAKTEHYDLRNEFCVLKSREIMNLFPGGARVPFI